MKKIIECIFPQGVEGRGHNREKMEVWIVGKKVLLLCLSEVDLNYQRYAGKGAYG